MRDNSLTTEIVTREACSKLMNGLLLYSAAMFCVEKSVSGGVPHRCGKLKERTHRNVIIQLVNHCWWKWCLLGVLMLHGRFGIKLWQSNDLLDLLDGVFTWVSQGLLCVMPLDRRRDTICLIRRSKTSTFQWIKRLVLPFEMIGSMRKEAFSGPADFSSYSASEETCRDTTQ